MKVDVDTLVNEVVERVKRDFAASPKPGPTPVHGGGGERRSPGDAQSQHQAQAEKSRPVEAPPSETTEADRRVGELIIDLGDPTTDEARRTPAVDNPFDPDALGHLIAAASNRICVGRAGARPKTAALLRFQADHGVTQDAIYSEVKQEVLDRCKLFTVQSQVPDRDTYLLRPDLGRKLSQEARETIDLTCTKNPQVQVVAGDGLSAAATNNNLESILPVIQQGLDAQGITTGTPFFVRYCRVGIMNDINTIIGAQVVILLIGERPGLGVADALSAYMGYRPEPGKTDGDRDAFCMITDNGGTNPLEAGAYIVEQVKTYLHYQASGIALRLKRSKEG